MSSRRNAPGPCINVDFPIPGVPINTTTQGLVSPLMTTDVLARSICGEGMPNFYANYSEMPHECHPGILPYMFPYFKFCIPMDSYNFTRDENGNPLIE